ncbi:tudor domain-containing protein 7 [Grus japonensis]|uniref:Tudor domain-containing protein 7 n=1 Tax=Grus japonensis TaxID=30415 RepID=A0ABC9Y7G4_GRUJA
MGRQVNCQMRLKNTSPVTLAGKPKGTLRQPRSLSRPEEGSKRPVPRPPRGRGVACGVVKPTMESARSALSPAAGSGPSKELPMQRHVTVVNRALRYGSAVLVMLFGEFPSMLVLVEWAGGVGRRPGEGEAALVGTARGICWGFALGQGSS